MSNNNKDKKTGNQQPKAEAPANETPETKTQPDNTPTPGTGTDTQGNAAAPGETVHPNPERAASDAAEAKAADKAAETKEPEEPKVSDALVKIGKSILKSNPAMSVVYMASDGRGFYEQNDADNHARTLENKTVTPVKK